ncbi:MAG: DUF1638 domain-containing protein [Acidimicrobiales bacterium]|nr:DUF1638 domain-containing protein [Acidimicrobiales bacterium]
MIQPTGVPAAPGGRTLVVACGALATELLQVVEVNSLSHVDVECLPASFHNTPDVIPDAVAARIRAAVDRYQRIFVGYGDCGTGGRLDAVCAELGVDRLPGDHCYEFLTGSAAFADLHAEELGTFFLTDYLVKHFDRLVVKAFWLDTHPEMLATVFNNYRRLTYLSQTDNPELVDQARAAAERLGLTFEHRPTGLDHLEAHLLAGTSVTIEERSMRSAVTVPPLTTAKQTQLPSQIGGH